MLLQTVTESQTGEQCLGALLSLVPLVAAAAMDGLVERMDGQQSEGDGFVVVERQLHERHADRSIDVLVVRGLSLDHGTQSDDADDAASIEQPLGCERQFPSAWHPRDQDLIRRNACIDQRSNRAIAKLVGDLMVVFGNDDRKALFCVEECGRGWERDFDRHTRILSRTRCINA